jgi:hypothetical protein
VRTRSHRPRRGAPSSIRACVSSTLVRRSAAVAAARSLHLVARHGQRRGRGMSFGFSSVKTKHRTEDTETKIVGF